MEDKIWWKGQSQEIEWIQYGDFGKQTPILTITRDRNTSEVQFLLHDVSNAVENVKLPEYGQFSIETGMNEMTVGVDGFGFLILMSDGKTGFETPHSGGKNLKVINDVMLKIDDSFRFWVNQTCYTFPVANFKDELVTICRSADVR